MLFWNILAFVNDGSQFSTGVIFLRVGYVKMNPCDIFSTHETHFSTSRGHFSTKTNDPLVVFRRVIIRRYTGLVLI